MDISSQKQPELPLTSPLDAVEQTREVATQKTFELPGKNGHYNSGTGPVTAREVREAYGSLTPEEIAKQREINHAGAAAVRSVLSDTNKSNPSGTRAAIGSARLPHGEVK